MKPSTLIEILDAAHLTTYVDGPFKQRGGIMLIGPPETLRTTIIETALRPHPGALLLSDANVNSLSGLKDDFTSGRYSSIGFLDYQKIYERHSSTAANVEGTIRQMLEEGYQRSPHEDPTSPSTKARAFVVAAVVESFFKLHSRQWRETGYLRRWLCCLFFMPSLSRAKITNAIHEWELLEFDGIKRITPNTPIPYNITPKESAWLLNLVRDQPSQATPYVLMKKIFAVLKWKYPKEMKYVHKVINDFSPCLTKNGADISL